jgi:hypothetical protein
MAKKLLESKKEVIEHYLPELQKKQIETNNQIIRSLNKAILDKKVSGNVKLSLSGFLQIFEGNAEWASTTDMDSEDKLELARLYFENAKIMMESFNHDKAFFDSYMKSIDEELKLTMDEITFIDGEIRLAEERHDQHEKAKLLGKKNDLFTMEK